MAVSRPVSLSALTLLATAWAACLTVPGLWLMLDAHRVLPIGRGACRLAGLAGVTAGLFLFMVLVADRLIPGVGRRLLMWNVEMATFATFLACSVGFVVLLVLGTESGA